MYIIKDVKEENINDVLMFLSKEMNVDFSVLDVLYKICGDKFFYLLYIFENKKINFLSINKINNIIKEIEIKDFIINNKNNLKEEDLFFYLEKKFEINKSRLLKLFRRYYFS